MAAFTLNGTPVEVAAEPDTPLLWVLRDTLGFKGTKYGCGIGVCGICTLLVESQPVRACVTPLADVEGRAVTTIEGLAETPQHPVIRAWIEQQVPQCGYCQPGQVMAATALLLHNPAPSDADIDAALAGVLCRCGTYQRIRRAVHRAADLARALREGDAHG